MAESRGGWLVDRSKWADREFQASLPPAERTMTIPAGLPEFTLGYEAATWIEQNLRVPSGKAAGTPFRVSVDQFRFLLWYYAFDAERWDGFTSPWVYQRGVRRLAKGSGKSPFAAALALFELLGPCRVGEVVDPGVVPGGVIGRVQELPLVQLAATSEQQTGVTMRLITGMAHKRTELAKKYELETGRTYVITPSGGRIQLLTSSSAAAEGWEASFAVADEVEHWYPSTGAVEFHQTLRRNLAKTGNRIIETCNAWVPGRDSVAEQSFSDWVDQESGKTRDEFGILYDARLAPSNTVLTDSVEDGEVGLSEALEFVYGEQPWVDLEPIKREVWSPSNPVAVSRRFYLNQPNTADDAWVSLQEWSSMAKPDRELVDGEDVVLFFDGSKSGDHTALVGCCMSDGHVFTAGVWRPGELSGVVDVGAVDSMVRRMGERFNVVAFWADVREWESFVKVSWPEVFAESLVVPAQKHGKAAAWIAWDMRSHGFDFAVAAEMCKAEIEDSLFTHDGNWETSQHIGNARMREQRGHVSIRKESPKSPNKIDAAVCVIGARMVYRAVLSSAEWEKYSGQGEDWTVFL